MFDPLICSFTFQLHVSGLSTEKCMETAFYLASASISFRDNLFMGTLGKGVPTTFISKPQLIGTRQSNYLYVDIRISQLAASSIRFKGFKIVECPVLYIFSNDTKKLIFSMQQLYFYYTLNMTATQAVSFSCSISGSGFCGM